MNYATILKNYVTHFIFEIDIFVSIGFINHSP